MKFQQDRKTVYDYGTLAKDGEIEYVFSDYAWMSSVVPEVEVLGLNYLWPKDNTTEVLKHVVQNGTSFEKLKTAFASQGLIPFTIMTEGWQWITATSDMSTLEKMSGDKIRVMGSDILNATYEQYGFTTETLNYGEIYDALDNDTIDAQVNPIWAVRSMSFYDVTTHFTQMWSEPFFALPTVNKAHFESLPTEYQELIRGFWLDNMDEAALWVENRTSTDRQWIEDNTTIVFSEFDDTQIGTAEEEARKADTEYTSRGTEEADILTALKSDIAAAEAAISTP